MDQWTAAQCWLYERKLEYRQRVVSALMVLASKHGAKIDWDESDIEQQIIAFSIDPDDEEEFCIALAELLDGEIE